MQKIKTVILSLALMCGLVGVSALPAQAALCTGSPKDCINSGVNKVDNGAKASDLTDTVKNIVNIILYLIGAIAVIMIIIAGFRYVVSGGEQKSVQAAKDTILYSVIGIVVAFMAYAIVNFVIVNL